MLEATPGVKVKRIMKSCIGYFDPHLSFGSFSLKTKLQHICSGMSSLPFCSSGYMLLLLYSYSVVCSLKPISIRAFQNRADVEKIWRSTLESHFEMGLEIKQQMQTVLLIKIGSKNICLAALQRAVIKLNKCLRVVTYEKIFICTRTDKW